MIVVECYRDQTLAYRLHFVPEQVRHAHNKSRVLGTIEKLRKGVGLIDEDPGTGRSVYLKRYRERNVEGDIKLLVREDDNGKTVIRRVIQISPRLEDWLYKIAARNGILPEKFDLPEEPKKLHSMSLRSGKNLPNFQRFLDALRKKNDNEINTLRKWIREVME